MATNHKAVIFVVSLVILAVGVIGLTVSSIRVQEAHKEVIQAEAELAVSMGEAETAFSDCLAEYAFSKCMLVCMENASEETCTKLMQNVEDTTL